MTIGQRVACVLLLNGAEGGMTDGGGSRARHGRHAPSSTVGFCRFQDFVAALSSVSRRAISDESPISIVDAPITN